MMLEVNKRVYLEGRSPYLKTHCDKKRSVREVLGLLMESVAIDARRRTNPRWHDMAACSLLKRRQEV
jgi:hypothetical protein